MRNGQPSRYTHQQFVHQEYPGRRMRHEVAGLLALADKVYEVEGLDLGAADVTVEWREADRPDLAGPGRIVRATWTRCGAWADLEAPSWVDPTWLGRSPRQVFRVRCLLGWPHDGAHEVIMPNGERVALAG